MTWRLDEFERSLTAVASATVGAYRRDVSAFVAWAERGGVHEPSAVDRLLLRRYLAYLTTRRYARRSIARAASSLRRYFAWLRRTGAIAEDPAHTLSAPRGEARLPRVLRADELHALLDEPPAATLGRRSPCAGATTPCSSCSTAAGSGWPSSARSTWAMSPWPAGS